MQIDREQQFATRAANLKQNASRQLRLGERPEDALGEYYQLVEETLSACMSAGTMPFGLSTDPDSSWFFIDDLCYEVRHYPELASLQFLGLDRKMVAVF